MNFIETKLKGAYIIESERWEAKRGFLPARGANANLKRMA